MFEWSEAKRLRILRDRELDFRDAAQIFDGRPVLHMRSFRNNEERTVSIADIEGKFYTVVWTWRGESRRIIVQQGQRCGRKTISCATRLSSWRTCAIAARRDQTGRRPLR